MSSRTGFWQYPDRRRTLMPFGFRTREERRERRLVEHIASQEWTYTRPDGTVAKWRQEDEEAAKSKEEEVGILQRCADFWIGKLTADLQTQKGLEPDDIKI
jgi:hypothetical protein